VKPLPRRIAAAVIALALMLLVVCDLSVQGFRVWFDNHSLTASIVSNLLVLGVTALIVDEVVARRQRNERASTVAVQAAIVYDQAQRTYSSLLAAADQAGEPASGAPEDENEAPGPENDAPEELRALANMLLTSSPSLFDDPQARLFLEDVQRLTGVMFRASSTSLIGHAGKPSREAITTAMDRLHASATPLIQRLSAGYRAAIDEPG
jgi:hypothetical protein